MSDPTSGPSGLEKKVDTSSKLKVNSMEGDIKAQTKGKLVYLKLNLNFRDAHFISSIRVCFVEEGKIENLLLESKRWKELGQFQFDQSYIAKLCKKYEISQQQVLALIVDFDGDMTAKTVVPRVSPNDDPETCESIEIYVTPPSTVVFQLKTENGKDILDIELKDCPFYIIRSAISHLRSTFDNIYMRKGFPNVKKFSNNSEILKELEEQTDCWEDINAVVRAFNIIKENTKSYKNEVVVFGDVCKKWQNCLKELRQSNSEFDKELCNNMETSLNMLLKYDIFLAPLYIDPRHNKQLTGNQIEKAQKYLVNIFKKIQVIDNPERDESVIEQANAMEKSRWSSLYPTHIWKM